MAANPELLRTLSRQRGGVIVTSDAVAAGFSAPMIRHRLLTGQWTKLRRGCYAESPAGVVLETARLQMAAAVAVVGPGAVVSHRSAAHLLGLDLAATPSPLVWITRPPTCRNGRHDNPGIIERAAQLPAFDVTTIRSLPCTNSTRTLFDLSRHERFTDAVAMTDAALRSGAVSLAGLDELASRYGSWPRARQARRVVDFASPLAESPLESHSRVLFEESGLPRATLQHEIRVGSTNVRLDFYWPAHRTIGEADGQLKYSDPEALWAEKRREDSLREMGFSFVRWGWSDVFQSPRHLVRRVEAAFAR